MRSRERTRPRLTGRLVAMRVTGASFLGTSRLRAVTAPSLEQTVDVETPELVVLTYSVAGIGSRALAAITDLVIVLVAFLLIGIAALALRLTRGFVYVGVSSSWGTALLVLAQFALLWGYYVLFEGLMDGQTPGKRLHRIRVVREGGYSVTFGVSAVRNLIRIIDMQPVFFYLVGMASVLLTKRGRRLGDLVAGTIVVREDVRRSRARARRARRRRQPGRRRCTRSSARTSTRCCRGSSSGGRTLEPLRRAALAQQLALRFGAALGRRRPRRRPRACSSCTSASGARALAASRRAARRAPAASDRRSSPRGARDGRRSRRSSTLAQKKGLRALGENGVRDFVAEYRALSADLARLRTAAGGRAVDELFYLGRLVAGAHNLLYRDRGMPLRARGALPLHRGARARCAARPRRSRWPRSCSSGRRRSPASPWRVIPTLAPKLLPPGMIQRAEDGVRRARNGEGYIDDPQLFRPVMASGIIANNVQVTFADVRRRHHGGAAVGLPARDERRLDRERGRTVREQGDRAAAHRVRRAARRARAVRHLRGRWRRVHRRRRAAPAGRPTAPARAGGERASRDPADRRLDAAAPRRRHARGARLADRVVADRGEARRERHDARAARDLPAWRTDAARRRTTRPSDRSPTRRTPTRALALAPVTARRAP